MHWKIEEWWKKKVACVWELKDRGMRKIIIFIIIKDMHVECVSGWMKIIILLIIRGMHVECVSEWMVCTYLYIYIYIYIYILQWQLCLENMKVVE